MYWAAAVITAGSRLKMEASRSPAKHVIRKMTKPQEKEIACARNRERTARFLFPAPIFCATKLESADMNDIGTMERNTKRRVLRGTVVSDKMDKTIVVEINTHRSHPLYGKRVKFSRRFKAHDENNEAKIGDTVEIMETRPLSKDKHFRLTRIVEKAVIL